MIERPETHWFHSFDLGNGETIEGIKPLAVLNAEADLILGEDLSGKSVLDICAWDGFFSFEAERRGAARVVATDHFCWSGAGWGTRTGFDYVHAIRNSAVEAVDMDVHDLPKSDLGQFDMVLFLGVFYHLKDPYTGLEAAAAMCRDHLAIETVTALPRERLPAMRLFDGREMDGDPTNFWAPNIPALSIMLRNFGFARVEFMPSPVSVRHPLNATPFKVPARDATHRTVVHAWRH
jgi:tRNA (mo5U34)-methyltransferase